MVNDEGELDARQQVSTQHVEFLVNMSRATRRRDWAWFEIAETELQKLYVLEWDFIHSLRNKHTFLDKLIIITKEFEALYSERLASSINADY